MRTLTHPVLKFVALVLVVCAITALHPAQSAGEPLVTPLTIETEKGRFEFTVEVAATAEQRMRGLMFRQSLPRERGMLFDYGAPQPVAMWMKNTYIPLDILFIGSDGRIVNIAERTIPHSLASIPSDGPVRAVLEVNGGTAARLGIAPGDSVLHKIFGD